MTPSQEAREGYPLLPEPAMEDVPSELWGQNVIYPALYTAEHMRSYVDADRKARQQEAREYPPGAASAFEQWHAKRHYGHDMSRYTDLCGVERYVDHKVQERFEIWQAAVTSSQVIDFDCNIKTEARSERPFTPAQSQYTDDPNYISPEEERWLEKQADSSPVALLFAAANEIHGAMDLQTYDDKVRADFDLADGHEFVVTITAAQERALSKAISGMESYVDADRKARQQEALDARRYRWLKEHHSWWMLKHFHNETPYVDAREVIDASIDAAIAKGEQHG